MNSQTQGLVSVVMSAYNSEPTIYRAVRSVLTQTHSDLEVIVVDDGSTDATRQIVQALAAEDPRVRLLDPAPNAGVSASRNRALAAASGDWVTFLDSDDEFTPDRLAIMLAAADDGADAVICRHTVVLPNGLSRTRGSTSTEPMSGRAAALASLANQITPFVWDKMYRASVVAGLRFAEDIHRSEDAIFCVEAHRNCQRVVFVTEALNIYYVSAGSLTWGRVPPLAESDRAVERVEQVASALGPAGLRAARVTRLITYMNSANLAQQRLPAVEYRIFAREVRRRIGWTDLTTAARLQPMTGAAALLLKSSPYWYSRLYGRYAARAYGLST